MWDMLLHSPPLEEGAEKLFQRRFSTVGAVYDRPYFVDSRRNGRS